MVFEKIADILSEQFDVEVGAIEPDTLLTDDLGADSLDLIDIVMSLEDEFGREVPDEALEGFETVGDLVDYIESRI